MESVRRPFQGVWNVLHFNWHYYLLSIILIVVLSLSNYFLSEPFLIASTIATILVIITSVTSLVVSFYVYDLSGLYKLNWLNELSVSLNSKIVSINAGFDETSTLLQTRYPDVSLIVYDFYDPMKHTEISIQRARKKYLPFEGTLKINTSSLPLPNNSTDHILLIFSAHEIRNEIERNLFFNELKRILKPDGKIVLLEHLRDVPNFLAYNVGFLHFMSRSTWLNTFKSVGLAVSKEVKITPLITNFILEK